MSVTKARREGKRRLIGRRLRVGVQGIMVQGRRDLQEIHERIRVGGEQSGGEFRITTVQRIHHREVFPRDGDWIGARHAVHRESRAPREE